MSNKITENTSKSEISKEVKIYLDSKEFKSKIEKIVKDRLKDDKELEDKMVEISKNVITQLYKTLWTRRSFWRSNLSNKAS
jgi:tryptophanyl-tRNA synthetase